MLSRYKDARPKNKGKKCFHVCQVFRNFFREGAPNFNIFLRVVFSDRIILKHIENKKDSRGYEGMPPRKMFENLHTVKTVLVLFEQFLGKFCLNFLPPNLSVSPNTMHFVFVHFRLLVLRAFKAYCYRKGSKS